MAPAKRKTAADVRAELSAAEETNKRRKSAFDAVVKEFVCPISLELPVEPVTAEDGRVYNRADIQDHIDDNGQNGNLRSPVTWAPMGPTLVPAVQVQNSLRALIEGGAVEDDSAERLETFIETRKKADAGDTEAMCDLSSWYFDGTNGLHHDYKQAYMWCSKAADLNSVRGVAYTGAHLYIGLGVAKDEITGAALLGMAAGKDNALACFILGAQFYKGTNGLRKDRRKARHMLRKVGLHQDNKKDTIVGLTDEDFEDCKRMLKDLEEDEQIRG